MVKSPRHLLKRLPTKRLIFLFLFVTLLGLVSLFFWSRQSHSVEAAWWNDSWLYRNVTPVTAHTASESNVYVSVTINSSANFQADCGDLRWTNEGGTLLPYYLVSGCGTSSTVVHVQLNSFPAGAQSLYYYYGNPSAPNGFSATDFPTEAANYTIGTIGSQEKSNGPVAYWDFNEGTGTSARDRTSNGNNGTLTNMSSTSATNSGWITPDRCVSQNCLAFDGTDDYVAKASPASLPSGQSARTIAAWVKPANSNPGGSIIHYGNDSASGQEFILQDITIAGNTYLFTDGVNANNNIIITGSEIPTNNEWSFMVLVFDGSSGWSYYLNGSLKKSGTFATTINTATPTVLNIGDRTDSSQSNYPGLIDEPKIYNYARSAAQIQADYNNRISEMKGASAVLGAETTNALNNGLVGYWKMDESSWNGTAGEVKDASGNGNNGVAVSGASTGTGKFGNGGSFDGTSKYINLGTRPTLAGATSGTVVGWINATSFSTTPAIYTEATSSIGYTRVGLYVNSSGKVQLGMRDSSADPTGSAYVLTGATTLSTSTWYHIAITFDSTTATRRIYVNGQIDNSDATSFSALGTSSTAGIHIGALKTPANYFNGLIDETRIYNRALSPAEIQQLYNFAPGPVGYWNFEEGQGTSVADSSTYANNGTWNGQAPYWGSGKVGKAGKFNGSDSYVSTPSFSSASQGTYSFWVKPRTLGLNEGWIDNPGTSGFGVDVFQWGGSVYFRAGNQTSYSLSAWSPDTWHHVAMSWNGTNFYGYLDGILVASGTQSGNFSGVVNMGRVDAGYYFNGSIDEVRLYNYARTQAQIVEDMKATGSLGITLGGANRPGTTVGYWDFDQGTGTIADDRSGNGNNATLANMSSPATAVSGWSQNGKVNKALSFDGSNDYLSIPDANSLDFGTGDFSVSGWLNPSNLGASNKEFHIIDKSTGYQNTPGWLIEASTWSGGSATSYTLIFSITNNTWLPDSGYIISPAFYSVGQWLHYVAVRSGTTLNLYVNGKLVKTATHANFGGDVNNSTTLSFAHNRSIGGTYFFPGQMDEQKMYNYALTPQEVQSEFNQTKSLVLGSFSDTSQLSGGSIASNSASAIYCVPGDSTSCAGPVAEWNFEEGAGTSVSDTTGNANTGTWNGTAPYWTQGKQGWGGNFNGSNGYVDVGAASSANITSNLSIGAWVRTTSTVGQTIIGRRNSGGNAGYYFALRGSAGNYGLTFTYFGSFDSFSNDSAWSPDGKWHYYSMTYDRTTVRFYVDGKPVGTSAQTLAGVSTTTPNLTLGALNDAFASGPTNFMNGSVDQVQVFNYARTPAQVAWDYNKGKPVARWDFDECQGSVANDSIGSNPGTINIGASGTQTTTGTCQTVNAAAAWYNGRVGKFNSSLNFDGTDDYVDLGSTQMIDSSRPFSISSWVYLNGYTSSFPGIINLKTDQATGFEIWISQAAGYTGIDFGSNSNFLQRRSAGDISADFVGRWQHITLVYDGAGRTSASSYTLYNNGSRLDTVSTSGFVAVPNTNKIGHVAGAANTYFPGKIDDTRVYNYALTPIQVKQVYNEGFGVRFGPTSGTP